MDKKKIIILTLVVLFLSASIVVGVYLASQRQNTRSQADEAASGGADSCPTPPEVTNTKVEYPSCLNDQCSFTEASCSWDAVSGAANYKLKITEVDSNSVVKDETVSSDSTRAVFPVTQQKTYQCDVTAVNSCGGQGSTGSDSLLCEVDGLVSSPSPTVAPTAPPVAPTAPPVAPPAPTPTPVACGFTGCSTSIACQAGFVCIKSKTGANYCGKIEYQNECFDNPGVGGCCMAPVKVAPAPTALPKTADLSTTMLFSIGSIGLFGLGLLLFLLS